MKGLFSAILLLVASCAVAQQEDIYDKSHTQEFAEYLMAARDYKSAVMEYERLLFMDPESDSIRLRLLQAYNYSGSYQQGISRFHDFYSPRDSAVPQVFAKEYLELLLRDRDYLRSQDFVKQSQSLRDDYKRNVQAGILLLQRDWGTAGDYAEAHAISDPYLRELASRGQHLDRKSPVLASVLSAVVPGSGKMYTGKWADGAMALLFVGANAFGSYRGFQRNGVESFYGWFFGAVGTGFYIGNIYGSYRATQDYNYKNESLLHYEVENYFYTRY